MAERGWNWEVPEAESDRAAHMLSAMDNNHAVLLKAGEGLSTEELWWRPVPEMVSIGNLLAHCAGSENTWVRNAISGEGAARNRDHEFAAERHGDLGTLTTRLDEVRANTKRVVGALSDAELSTPVERSGAPRGPGVYRPDWVLAVLIYHEAHHAGQAHLIRRLIEARRAG
jgi:uncharacterized damage-inducible protein DinB